MAIGEKSLPLSVNNGWNLGVTKFVDAFNVLEQHGLLIDYCFTFRNMTS